ncbi:MAG: hypothetical protein K2P63_03945 [Lachnospiraceae bacterium]|nr:hypothetical protein [Lachnospiraceae bacterium]
MRRRKIFWGIFFIGMALAVIASKLGLLPDVGVFALFATVFLAWMAADGFRRRNFFEMLFAAAFLCIIYDEPLGIEVLTPWTVLAAALLLGIGFTLLFSGWRKRKHSIEMRCNSGAEYGGAQCSGECIRCDNSFGATIRYINSDNFRSADLENNFGDMALYFDNAIIQGDAAVVKVENNFGAIRLYIPREWKVQNKLGYCFGRVNEYGKMLGTSSAELILKGGANFGVIEIYYV